MPAYVIVDATVHDPDAFATYMAASPSTIAASSGRFLARGGEIATLEGDWHPKRIVVLEFADLEAAKRWYASEDYQAAITQLDRRPATHQPRSKRPWVGQPPCLRQMVSEQRKGAEEQRRSLSET